MNLQNSEDKKKEEERLSEVAEQHSEHQVSEASQPARDSVALPPATAAKSPERVETESAPEAKKEKTASPSSEVSHMIIELNKEIPKQSTDVPHRSAGVPQATTEVPQTTTEVPQMIREVLSTTTEVAPVVSTELPQIAVTELQQVVSKEVLQVSAEVPQVCTEAPNLNTEANDENTEVSKVQQVELQVDPTAQHITTETLNEPHLSPEAPQLTPELEIQSTEQPKVNTETQNTDEELEEPSKVCKKHLNEKHQCGINQMFTYISACFSMRNRMTKAVISIRKNVVRAFKPVLYRTKLKLYRLRIE